MNDTLLYVNKLLQGQGIDIHNLIGKLPKPKKGWVLPNYRYCGPYNPLEKQVDITGKPLPGNEPYNQLDDICRRHDIAYDKATTKAEKHEADEKMLQELKAVEPATLRQFFEKSLLRNIIGTKYKLGFGLSKQQENLLRKIYYSPSTGYTGIDKLSRRSGINKEAVKDWLRSQDVYTKFKPAIQKFPMRKTIVPPIYKYQAQCDLIDMRSLSAHNNNNNWILTCIDVLTRQAFAIAIQRKTGDDVTRAFTQIFKRYLPRFMHSDLGSEFINKKTQQLFKDKRIHWFKTGNLVKCAILERFHKTLKSIMYRYFESQNTKRWIDVLPKLIKNYNTSFHRTLRMSPLEATKNPEQAWRNIYSQPTRRKPPKFKVGQFVRISKYRGTFKRGYTANYTDEVFVITEVLKTAPVTYRIAEIRNADNIIGTFYEQELSLFKPKDVSQIINST